MLINGWLGLISLGIRSGLGLVAFVLCTYSDPQPFLRRGGKLPAIMTSLGLHATLTDDGQGYQTYLVVGTELLSDNQQDTADQTEARPSRGSSAP